MLAAGVPCAPVRNLTEVMTDRNMLERGALQWVDHPQLGRVVLPHTPLNIDDVPRRPLEPSLPLGACNADVLGTWLGHSEAELAQWKADGVI